MGAGEEWEVNEIKERSGYCCSYFCRNSHLLASGLFLEYYWTSSKVAFVISVISFLLKSVI